MKIAVLDDYVAAALRLGNWDGLDVTVFDDTITDHSALVARLAPFDVICLMRERTPLGADLIAALPQLKCIITTGPRNASIDVRAANDAGIVVCGTQSRKTTTSELSILMMLALNRRLMPEVAGFMAGGWQSGLGRDVAGLTLGLIGLGNIGGQMAVLGRALGMEVCAWSQNLTQARADDVGVTRMESLTDLMASSDVASVHLVLSDRSRGLIGADAFAAAKQGQVFINTSRGPIIDTGALLEGLRRGHPAKAGIDVYDVEPVPVDNPLLDRDLIESGQLLLTPHLGYTVEATFKVFYEQSAEAVRAFIAGNPIRVIEP